MELDKANETNFELQKNIKLYQETICKLQKENNEKQRNFNDITSQLNDVERREQVELDEKNQFIDKIFKLEQNKQKIEAEMIELKKNLTKQIDKNNLFDTIREKLETEIEVAFFLNKNILLIIIRILKLQ